MTFAPSKHVTWTVGFIDGFGVSRGGGILPIMAYTGRLRPKRVPFSGFRYKKVGISQVEVYKRVGKSVI